MERGVVPECVGVSLIGDGEGGEGQLSSVRLAQFDACTVKVVRSFPER